MSEVHAFVGHSFIEEDQRIVDIFLELFRTFSDTGTSFKWDHAKKAEPQDLATKVLQKMEGKNTFIGICTRKEEVIKSRYSRTFLRWRILETHELEWKTSDWIMQEIGLAIGKQLKLVLFVENGVRRPGGLQGDVEYIPFNRDNPQESFVKFMQMFSSLVPARAPGMATSVEEVRAQEPDDKNPADDNAYDFWTPKPTWSRQHYERAIFLAILESDDDKIVGLEKAYQNSECARSERNASNWVSYCETIKIIHGKGGDFAKIKHLVSTNSDNPQILNDFGRVCNHYGKYDQAAEAYIKAASYACCTSAELESLKRAALSHHANGNASAVWKLADQIREKLTGEAESELLVLEALHEIYQEADLDSLNIGLMERIMEVNPSDNNTRFSLAYKHSNHGSQEASFYHYLLIGVLDRSAAAWNNLGVLYSDLQLPIGAVHAFRRSKYMSETLAMSNLANRYIMAGFLDEARAECAEATKLPNYHTNVNASLTRIAELPAKEAKKEAEIVERARRRSEFLQQFGRAVCRPFVVAVAETWKHPKCSEVTVALTGSEFRAVGSYDRPVNALAAALTRSTGGFGLLSQSERVTLTYQGTLHGCALAGTITKDDGRPKSSSILDSDDPRYALIYLSDDGTEWHVMENPFGKTPEFYSLTR